MWLFTIERSGKPSPFLCFSSFGWWRVSEGLGLVLGKPRGRQLHVPQETSFCLCYCHPSQMLQRSQACERTQNLLREAPMSLLKCSRTPQDVDVSSEGPRHPKIGACEQPTISSSDLGLQQAPVALPCARGPLEPPQGGPQGDGPAGGSQFPGWTLGAEGGGFPPGN